MKQKQRLNCFIIGFFVMMMIISTIGTSCDCLVSPPLKGDMNCDEVVNLLDINPFILALSNPSAYEAAYPYCDIMNADCNWDDVVDLRDINPFVTILTSP